MSVFKEAYALLKKLHTACISNPIYTDSADSGLAVTIGDRNFNAVKTFIEDYGVKGTRITPAQNTIQHACAVMNFTNGNSNTEFYIIQYITVAIKHSLVTPCNGYFTVRMVMPSEHQLRATLTNLHYKIPPVTNDIHPDIDPAGGYGLSSHV